MSEIARLSKRSIEVIQSRGLNTFFIMSKQYMQSRTRNRREEAMVAANTLVDVLFINGCTLPHPSRYRVDHQIEQLFASDMSARQVVYTHVKPEMIKLARLIVIFRCPHTQEIEDVVKEAKAHNKPVIFDIDDLVIDLKYTNTIKYLENLSKDERALYDDGVARTQRLMLMCDAAVTTTEALAGELEKYLPEVFINRNVASNEMMGRSDEAVYERDVLPCKEGRIEKGELKRYKQAKRIHDERVASGSVRVGYFSGSITHNDDIQMILPVLADLLKQQENVELHIVGELDIPEELSAYGSRIVAHPFVDWRKLPELVSQVDINIAPLTESIFNEAKSEIKWIEAALVKVPTIASKVGAFDRMIEHEKTGILCSTLEEWQEALLSLVNNKELRQSIGEQAYEYASGNCSTISTCVSYANYIKSKTKPNLAFILPSTQISGGIRVALTHCAMLMDAGVDAFLISERPGDDDVEFEGKKLYVFDANLAQTWAWLDTAVSSLWTTNGFFVRNAKIRKYAYLVQNYETGFYRQGDPYRIGAQASYASNFDVEYLTISRWCEDWLLERFGKTARFAPNGIDIEVFSPAERPQREKKRVLIEGNSNDFYKNVDESFRIAEKLDPARYEIWYLSYEGKPKSWYRVDKFLHQVPFEKVVDVYRSCDILLKSSKLESFSYPPLEMMATGGAVVVAPNEGNVEYLVDEENCLMYEPGNIDAAVAAIDRLYADAGLCEKLYKNGLDTAEERNWKRITPQILSLYGAN